MSVNDVLHYKGEIKLSMKPNELLLSLSGELITGWSYFNDQNGGGDYSIEMGVMREMGVHFKKGDKHPLHTMLFGKFVVYVVKIAFPLYTYIKV